MEERSCRLDQPEFAVICQQVLSRGKRIQFRALGVSMSPFINDGDLVVVAPLRDRPGIGDVILVKTVDGRTLLHRVIAKQSRGVITRGDALGTADGLTPWGSLLGKAVEVVGRGSNLHLRAPFKLLIPMRPSVARIARKIPGLRMLGRVLARVLS